LSNPTLFNAGFGRGECQRLEMLLAKGYMANLLESNLLNGPSQQTSAHKSRWPDRGVKLDRHHPSIDQHRNDLVFQFGAVMLGLCGASTPMATGEWWRHADRARVHITIADLCCKLVNASASPIDLFFESTPMAYVIFIEKSKTNV
jgi:hypothetical protein